MIKEYTVTTKELIEKTKFYNDKVVNLYNKSRIRCISKEFT